MSRSASQKQHRLGHWLFALFSLALLMGPGPGVLLVNPDPADPDAARFFFGMPVVYAWAGFWLCIQGLVVTLACCLLWRAPEPGDDG